MVNNQEKDPAENRKIGGGRSRSREEGWGGGVVGVREGGGVQTFSVHLAILPQED